MDINEATKEIRYRHPWELSRTKCILRVIAKYRSRLCRQSEHCIYVNTGAGDLYFDKALLRRYRKDEVYAVDIGYTDMVSGNGRIHKYHYLEEVPQEKIDYAIMMDSLEYMEDDVEYVRKMSRKIKKGGYFFFTLPAFSALFSEHDKNVKNLRRYDSRSFDCVLERVQGLKKVEEHYFYTSLLLVRCTQKLFHLPIDPKHKVTTGWNFSESSFMTRLLTWCLNLDFLVNRLFSKMGIKLPGLSLLVVCRRTGKNGT